MYTIQRSGVIIIKSQLSDEEYRKTCAFLKRVSALLPTHQVRVEANREKNRAFMKRLNLRQTDIERIIGSITADDCFRISQNNNSRYPDAEVYEFLPHVELMEYGETNLYTLYIKEYIVCDGSFEMLVIISLHEEGEYE